MASSYNENQHRDRAGQDGPLGKARHAAGAAKDRAVGFAKDPDVKRLGGQLLGTARALWEVASSDEAKGVYRKAGDALKDAWAGDDAGAGASARRRGVLGAGTAGTAAPHAATGIDPDMVSGSTDTTGAAGDGGATNPSGLPHPSGPAGADGTA